MQLLMAVGAVHIARPAVDYQQYLIQGTDSHSEGVCKFFFTAAVLHVTYDHPSLGGLVPVSLHLRVINELQNYTFKTTECIVADEYTVCDIISSTADT